MKRTNVPNLYFPGGRICALLLSAILPFATLPEVALALPHGGRVTKGHATLSYSTNRLLIRQSTSSASFSWKGFNVGSAQSVRYRTPGSKSVSMNFIGGSAPAVISGKVTSNGILYFMDANGLVFGSASTVSAAGIRAYGSAAPGGTPTGPVTNEGVLSAGPAGQVVLVGTDVANAGTIDAPSGQVVLAAGSTVTVSRTTSSSLSVVSAGGGTVTDSGIIRAKNTNGTPGTIVLEAGMNSGTTTLTKTAVLDAGAPNGGNGGSITVDGNKVVLNETAPLDVSAPSGTAGTITVDPTVTDVGTVSALESIDASQGTYLNNSSVCIALTANLNLKSGNTPYNWTPLGNGSSSSSYFIGAFNGQGHTVSGYTVSATGNNGTGFIGYLGTTGVVKNLGVMGTVNGGSYSTIGGVVGYNAGTVQTSYTTGSVTGTHFVGGVAGKNLHGTVKNSSNTGNVSGSSYVGGVVGNNFLAAVQTSYNTGNVSGTAYVGGVVGDNNGTVQTSYNTGSVTGSSGSTYVGGVAGHNDPTKTVETSYNTGNVSGSSYVGGVVGYNAGTVTSTYYNSTVFTGAGIGGGASGTATGLLEGTGANQLGNTGSYLGTGWTFASVWNGNGFSTSGTWIMGTVYPNGGAGTTAPILVSMLPADTVTETSGTSVYSGTAVTVPTTQSVTLGGASLASGISVPAAGPNVGSYTVTPTVAALSLPATQTSMGSYSVLSGIWTIDPKALTFSGSLSNPTKPYDGTTATTLTTSNSSASLSGFVNSQSADYTGATGSFSKASVGTHTVTAILGTSDFSTSRSGFSWSNYTIPSMVLTGTGTITMLGAEISEGVFSNLAYPTPLGEVEFLGLTTLVQIEDLIPGKTTSSTLTGSGPVSSTITGVGSNLLDISDWGK